MGRDLHFSFEQLPARYQAQIRNVDAVSRPRQNVEPAARDAACRPRLHRAPVNMPRVRSTGPNKTEAQFNRDILLGRGKYEAMTLHLPGGVKFTPDWLFEEDGTVYLVEVKGSYHLPTHGRSVMAFKVACTTFPMFTFLFAELGKNGRTWKIGTYRNGLSIDVAEGTAKELHEMGEK